MTLGETVTLEDTTFRTYKFKIYVYITYIVLL